MFSGGTAGAASVLGNTPVDVIKTKMQGLQAHKYNGVMDCVRQTYASGGVKAFYSGVSPRLARVTLDVAIVMTLYSSVNRALDKLW